MIEAAAEREAADYRVALFAAWHAVALDRLKRLPRLEELMGRVDRRRKPSRLSPAEAATLLKMMQKAYGGAISETVH